jgi:hypothetical protein
VVNTIQLISSQSQITIGGKTHYKLTDWMPAGYNLMSLYDTSRATTSLTWTAQVT